MKPKRCISKATYLPTTVSLPSLSFPRLPCHTICLHIIVSALMDGVWQEVYTVPGYCRCGVYRSTEGGLSYGMWCSTRTLMHIYKIWTSLDHYQPWTYRNFTGQHEVLVHRPMTHYTRYAIWSDYYGIQVHRFYFLTYSLIHTRMASDDDLDLVSVGPNLSVLVLHSGTVHPSESGEIPFW